MKCDCGARETRGSTLHRPQCATRVVRVTADFDPLTAEVREVVVERAVRLVKADAGKLGGKARAKGLTAERRSEIAREAAKKRWAKS